MAKSILLQEQAASTQVESISVSINKLLVKKEYWIL